MVGLFPSPHFWGGTRPSDPPRPTARYVGHKNQQCKLDCCLSERDTHVVSCSEDGNVFFWDLAEVSLPLVLPAKGISCVSPMLEKGNNDRCLSWDLWQRVEVCVSLCSPGWA